MSSYMISSVIDRSTNRSPAIPSYRLKSSGRPNRTPGRGRKCGTSRPVGWMMSVLIIAQGMTGTRASNTGVQSRFGRVGVLAVDRHLTNPPEEPARQPPLQAGRREVLRLGEKGHPPGHHHGHEERVAERQVIAGENCGALTRHIIQPLRPRAPYRAQERADGDIFQETVEHGPPPLARPSRVTVLPQA